VKHEEQSTDWNSYDDVEADRKEDNGMRPKLKYSLFGAGAAIMIAVVLIVWRYTYDPSITIVGFPDLFYPGFQTWPTPRSFDGPGNIFTLDDGYLNNIGRLNASVQDVGDETLSNYNGNTTWNGNVLSQFLGIFDAKLAAESNINVNVSLLGAHRWRIDPDQLSKAVNEWAIQHPNVNPYVVTESISVTEIDYVTGSNKVISGDAKLNVKNTQATVSSKQDDKGNWSLSAKYTIPHYVFYRAGQITRLHGLDHPEAILEEKDHPLRWQVESNK
jgi:hypothetical protein